jgi:hypothetical protein
VHLVVVNLYLARKHRHIHTVIPLHEHKTPAQIFYFVFNRAVGVPSQKSIMGTDVLHCAAAPTRMCSINHAAGSFAFIKYLLALYAIDAPQATGREAAPKQRLRTPTVLRGEEPIKPLHSMFVAENRCLSPPPDYAFLYATSAVSKTS